MPEMIASDPRFMDKMYAWRGDRSQDVPDGRDLMRPDQDFEKILIAMLGPEGYNDYIAALKAQRTRMGSTAPQPAAAPMAPTPGISDPQAGVNVLKKTRQEEIDEAQRAIDGR